MTKVCTKCGTEQAVDAFAKGSGRDGLATHCKECNRAWSRADRINNPERYKEYASRRKVMSLSERRDYQLQKKYGITTDQFAELLRNQNGRCAICETDKPRGQGTWHVDHCHETGAIRGLLCHPCNAGLGLLGDQPKVAAERLWKYAEATDQYLGDYVI